LQIFVVVLLVGALGWAVWAARRQRREIVSRRKNIIKRYRARIAEMKESNTPEDTEKRE